MFQQNFYKRFCLFSPGFLNFFYHFSSVLYQNVSASTVFPQYFPHIGHKIFFFLLFKQFSVFSSLSPVISPSPNYSQNRGCFCLHISIFYPPFPVLFFKSFKAHNPSPIYILHRRRLSPLFLIYKKYPQSPPRMLFPPPLFLSVYSRLPSAPIVYKLQRSHHALTLAPVVLQILAQRKPAKLPGSRLAFFKRAFFINFP